MIDVSVVATFYNCQLYVKDCMDSLVHQSLKNIEIIAVNDGSEDDTSRLLHEYEQNYPDMVRVIDQANAGPGAARNTGIAHAQGKYIAFCDGDDWVEPTMYEVLFDEAEKQNSDFVVCNIVRSKSPKDTKNHVIYAYLGKKPSGVSEFILNTVHSCSPCNKLVLRELVLNACVKFPECWYEDVGYTTALVTWVKKPVYVSAELYHYRITENSVTMQPKNYKKTRGYFEALAYAVEHHNTEYHDQLMALIAMLTNVAAKKFPFIHFEIISFIEPYMKELKYNRYLDNKSYQDLANRMSSRTISPNIFVFDIEDPVNENSLQSIVNEYRSVCKGFEVQVCSRSFVAGLEDETAKGLLMQGDWKKISDYCKLYVLYRFGGICVDSTIVPRWGFAHLVFNKAIVGLEESNMPHVHVLGAEKDHPLILNILSTYNHPMYVNDDWSLEERLNDYLVSRGWIGSALLTEKKTVDKLAIFPANYLLSDMDSERCCATYVGDQEVKEKYKKATLDILYEKLKKYGELEKQLKSKKDELWKVYHSKSWRITMPLRMAVHVLKKMKGRVSK